MQARIQTKLGEREGAENLSRTTNNRLPPLYASEGKASNGHELEGTEKASFPGPLYVTGPPSVSPVGM